MRVRKTVQYKGPVGSFRKMTRDRARLLTLARYDNSPIKGEAFLDALNLCIKGATVQEFLAERQAHLQKQKVKPPAI